MNNQLVDIELKNLFKAKWNYKTDGTEEQIEKLCNSIKEDKSVGVLAVREIKKGFEDTINSSQQFLMNQTTDLELEDELDDRSELPTPKLSTPNVNPNLFAKAPTGIMSMDRGLTPTESALLSPEEQQIRLRSRGIA